MARRSGLFFIHLIIAAILCSGHSALSADKVLSHDTGKKENQQSTPSGDVHMVGFDAPKGTWYITKIQIYGARYGGGYDPKETFFKVYVVDKEDKELSSNEAPYSVFSYGSSSYAWKEIVLKEAVKAPKSFKVGAAFNPTGSKGVFVGWSKVKQTHSCWWRPGNNSTPCASGKEWMIRAVLSKKKPKSKKPNKITKRVNKKKKPYYKDFEYIQKTVKSRYPCLKKKKIDWKKICKEMAPEFKKCKDDKTHILNAHKMLAFLKDSHTGITRSSVTVSTPGFDGIYSGGLWIASDRGRLVLRALSDGHDLGRKIQPGAELLTILDRPAKVAHQELRNKLKEYSGWSSDHFLDARISVQFFHFTKDPLPLEFLNPDGSLAEVKLTKRGSGGKGISRIKTTLPDGLAAKGLAVSKMVTKDIGYIRILGGMNAKTQKAFFKAFDDLREAKGVLLDCRGMGGGGDGAAWAIAGRFYPKQANLGINGILKPSGDWQFDGPVVMLQDEREMSSAETFTWSMTETGRVVSVGRTTGGATIIPSSFDAPSGLFSFRMGCSDRPTPIKQIRPEGLGTPPDVIVPYEPHLLKKYNDPIYEVAKDIVVLLIENAKREIVVNYYKGMLNLDIKSLKSSLKAFKRIKIPENKTGFNNVTENLVKPMVDWEIELLYSKHNPTPAYAKAKERLALLASVAGLIGYEDIADKAKNALSEEKWIIEIEAEQFYNKMIEKDFPPDEGALKAFLSKYNKTKYGKAAKKAFSKRK